MSKGGNVMENIGMLLAPRETMGIMALPQLRAENARKMDQGNALDQLIQGLAGNQPSQTIDINGQKEIVPPLKMSTQTMGNGAPVGLPNAGALTGGYSPTSGLGQFMQNQVPGLAMRADPETTLKALQSTLIDAPQLKEVPKGGSLVSYTKAGGAKTLFTSADDETTPEYHTALEISGGDKAKAAQLYNQWKTRAQTNVTVNNTPENKGLSEAIGAALTERRSNASSAYETKIATGRMRQALDEGLKTGAAAPIKDATSNWLVSLGADEKAVNDFYNLPAGADFDAASKEITRSLIKAFGANPSNSDRDFAEKMAPQLKTNPAAAKRLMDRIEKKADANIGIYRGMLDSAKSNPQSQWLQAELDAMDKQYGGLTAPQPAASTAAPAQPPGPPPIGKNGKPMKWVPE